MNDQIINELITKMVKIFATKDDLKGFATKDDLKDFATKDDLRNIATKDDLRNFVTKDDIKTLATKGELKQLEQNLTNEIRSVGKVLTDYMDEIDPKVDNHEKRLTKIESLPSIAHQIK